MSDEHHETKTEHTEVTHKSDEHHSDDKGGKGGKSGGDKGKDKPKPAAKVDARKSVGLGARRALTWVGGIAAAFVVICVIAVVVAASRHGSSQTARSSNTTVRSAAGSSDTCPNFDPKVREIGPDWVAANPEHPGAGCAFVFAVLAGDIDTRGPAGEQHPDSSATGRTIKTLITEVKARGDKATILYTFCRIGKQPDDDSAVCKS
jgi:hypothetical protein